MITKCCLPGFKKWQGWLADDALIQATALLARWWHWQPSEIDALPVEEFEAYIREANEQIKREYPDN